VSELTASTLLHVLDEPYEFYRTLRDCCGSLGDLRRQGGRRCAVRRGTGWAHFGHTQCPQRSILVNHSECHSAAQCRFDSETGTPKRVRFPAAPQRKCWSEP
jgi:hypothetical protein